AGFDHGGSGAGAAGGVRFVVGFDHLGAGGLRSGGAEGGALGGGDGGGDGLFPLSVLIDRVGLGHLGGDLGVLVGLEGDDVRGGRERDGLVFGEVVLAAAADGDDGGAAVGGGRGDLDIDA